MMVVGLDIIAVVGGASSGGCEQGVGNEVVISSWSRQVEFNPAIERESQVTKV